MMFVFYITANTAAELKQEIVETLENWFPSKEWMHSLECVTQLPEAVEVEKDGKKTIQMYFEVSVDVYQRSLKNMVMKLGRAT